LEEERSKKFRGKGQIGKILRGVQKNFRGNLKGGGECIIASGWMDTPGPRYLCGD